MKRNIFLLAALPLLLPLYAGAEMPSTIRIEMSEFAFRPATIHLTIGHPLRLVLVNRGQIAHQFQTGYVSALPVVLVSGALHEEAPGLDVVRLDPGGTARLEFLARKKGDFEFFCGIEGHREAGMHGILEVR
ncbi:MAG TPA: cupredoxin domain-containing protein [bacterium]|nr:cupredoxin domain-containing protein [bacterium]